MIEIEINTLHEVYPVCHTTMNHIALAVYEKKNVEQQVQDFVLLLTVLKFE